MSENVRPSTLDDERSRRVRPGLGVGLVLLVFALRASAAPPPLLEYLTETQPGVMIQKEGQVRFKPAAAAEIEAAVPQPVTFDEWLRTLDLSRAVVRLRDSSYVRLREFTRLDIRRQRSNPNAPSLSLRDGEIHVTSRGGRIAIPLSTPHVFAVPKGTEFLVRVDPAAARTEVTMFEGEAELSDGQTNRTVRGGEQGIVVPGQGIVIRPILEADQLIQWWIYYPAVIDPEELELPDDAALRASRAAYEAGDVVAALQRYPGYPHPASPPGAAETTYLAALFLAAGAVDRAEHELARLEHGEPAPHWSWDAPQLAPARALRILLRAVGHDLTRPGAAGVATGSAPPAPTASELLARSYAHQRTNHLTAAREDARAAAAQSPDFGFAWARVAELEFSFGRTKAARAAVDRALARAPRHAPALALRGYLLAAGNRWPEAIAAFDAAIGVDPALGNAWLGRGLCKRRTSWQIGPVALRTGNGAAPTWIEDIQTAAALEPRRSLFRSYAGKAFADAGLAKLARKEFNYAHQLDPNDPTPWLYEALLDQEEHRDNAAVHALEGSLARNDHRAVYRSEFLLDEDRAVRSSSLASVYAGAGLPDVSYREAARAVSDDAANYSAHLFLAESYNLQRDPTRFNLRYETPWFNELLLANLLAPVGGTPLSPHVSQQEYSRLFGQNRVGLSSATTYRSDGQVGELASQYGQAGSTAWSLDLDFQHNDGVRPNNDLQRIEWYTTIKQQLSSADSVLLLTKYQDYAAGDNFQYYDPASARPYYRFDESQAPIVLGGYHREWSPGLHTLVLGGRLANEQQVSDRNVQVPLVATAGSEVIVPGAPLYDATYENDFEAYTIEWNQLFQAERHLFNLGARFQSGEFDVRDQYTPTAPDPVLAPFRGAVNEPFERLSAYGYYTCQPVEPLRVQAGLAYDRVRYPATMRNPPVTPGGVTDDQVGPKAGVVWTPGPWVALRGAYSRSLGGVSLDQSYRLEPTQLAGFVQTYRQIMPVSLVGSVSAPEDEVAGGAVDLRLGAGTFAGVRVDRLESEAHRRIGVLTANAAVLPLPPAVPGSTAEDLDYLERSVGVSLNQLIAREWSLGARYAFSRSELHQQLSEIPLSALAGAEQKSWSELHRAGGFAQFSHASGLFAQAGLDWYWQHNWQQRYTGTDWVTEGLPGDTFPQVNLFGGWRFPRQRGELTVGVMNLTGTDYRLSPLNYYFELPRERVFYAQLRFRL